MQARTVEQELIALEKQELTGALLSLSRALRLLLAQQVARPHRYIWFIGD